MKKRVRLLDLYYNYNIIIKLYLFIVLITFSISYAEVSFVKNVYGYKKFEKHNGTFYLGDEIKIYIDIEDVSHEGFTAVDFLFFIRDEITKEVIKIDRVNVRYKNFTDKFYIVYKLDTSKLKPGRYSIKILGYDRAIGVENRLRLIKSGALDPSSKYHELYKKYLNAPTGLNVDDRIYSNLKLLRPYKESLLRIDKTLKFQIIKGKRKIEKIEKPTIAIKNFYVRVNDTYYLDDLIVIEYNLEGLIHNKTLTVDIYTLLYNKNNVPLKLKIDRIRFVNISEYKFIQRIDTKGLDPGIYYLRIKIFDRYQRSLIEAYKEIVERFPKSIDLIKNIRYIDEGVNINDKTYEILKIIKPLDNSLLVHDKTYRINLIEKPLEIKPKPRFIVNRIETDKIEYDIKDTIKIKVYITNLRGEGNVTFYLRIEGKEFGIRVPKTIYLKPKKEYIIDFNIPIEKYKLKDGFYRVGIEGVKIFTLIRIINKTALTKAIEERLKPVTEKEKEVKSPLIIYYLSGFLLSTLFLRILFNRNNVYKRYLNYLIILFVLLLIIYLLIYLYM